MLDEQLQPAGSDRAHAVVRAFVRAVAGPGVEPREWVQALSQVLPSHFAAEEAQGGLFDRLEGSGVSVLLVERLRADHRELAQLLRRLREQLAAGRDARADLAVFAERIREHEWIESTTAAQRGLSSWTEPPDLAPAGRALPADVVASVDGVADRTRAIAMESSTGDLLAAISVSVPDQLPLDGILARLEHALATRGLDFVDVAPCGSLDKEVRLCGARFRRPRVGTYLRSNFSIR